MLPLVRAITTDLVQLSREVIERRERLALLSAGRSRRGQAILTAKSWPRSKKSWKRTASSCRTMSRSCANWASSPRAVPRAWSIFPSMMDGRVVFLCWKLGEPEVLHWHELDAGFRGRQSLVAGSVADDAGRGSDRSATNAVASISATFSAIARDRLASRHAVPTMHVVMPAQLICYAACCHAFCECIDVMASPTAIVAYLALFAAVGFLFLFVNLLVGQFLRPDEPELRKAGSLRMRRADDRLELRAVRPAVLRRRAAVHHLRRRSGVLLSLGRGVRQSHAPDGPELRRWSTGATAVN